MPHQQTNKAPLSVHWAFVVHLRANSDVTHGQVAGRVEHVVSGQSTHFDSLEELLAFMARVLTTVRAPPRRRARSHSVVQAASNNRSVGY
mgnify:FL=1